MAATIIAKLASADTSAYVNSPFGDVPNGKWYTAPVAWAYDNKIVAGIGGGLFDPDAPVTRQDLMVLLYGYAIRFGFTTDQAGVVPPIFADAGQVSGYAVNAVAFAIRAGLIGGDNDGNLDPKGGATRAQTAQIIMKFKEIYG
jgi:hypothetical protein